MTVLWPPCFPGRSLLLTHLALVILAVWLVWWTITTESNKQFTTPGLVFTERPAQLNVSKSKVLMPKSNTRPELTTNTKAHDNSRINALVVVKSNLMGIKGSSAAKQSWTRGVNTGDFGDSIFPAPRGNNARKIAFLIDASGSLIDTLPFVISELKKSINVLHPKQSFTVVFFQGDKVVEIPPVGLKPANPTSKVNAMRWIEPAAGHVVPHGKTNPLAGVKKALSYRPHVLYLLSDNITGHGINELDQDTVVSEVAKANVGHTRINTIQFLYQDSLTRIGKLPTLKIISKNSGGIYKFVDRRSLGLE